MFFDVPKFIYFGIVCMATCSIGYLWRPLFRPLFWPPLISATTSWVVLGGGSIVMVLNDKGGDVWDGGIGPVVMVEVGDGGS